MIGIYTSRLGCLGSIVLSVVLTAIVAVLMRACA